MSRRFIFTLLTLIVIGAIASVAIFLAKGYRLSGQKGTIVGTGILSITSVPDQASIFLDGHLTSATNTNINSLPARKYKVRIEKEGFIPWEKEVEVDEGLVSQIKATLYRAIPSIYPLTYTGALNSALSPDGQKLIYVVPAQESSTNADAKTLALEQKKSGIWIWTMGEKPITLARGGEPHQIAAQLPGVDYTTAKFRFSPDSSEVLVTLPDRKLLLDTTRLNDPPKDITALVDVTLKSWDEDQQNKDLARLQLIKDMPLRQTASSSAVLKWAPDESKFLYSADGKKDFKVVSLLGEKGTPNVVKTYDLPASNGYSWMPDSTHLLLVESTPTAPTAKPNPNATSSAIPTSFPVGKVSVLEYDGFNKSELYVGTFEASSVIVWPDASRLVIVSSFPTATASKPNLYGINLK